MRVRDASLPPPERRRGTLLDVGCGVGDGMALARTEGWDCTGIEVSEEAAEIARARGFEVIVGDAAELELTGDRYDHVRCWHTVEHVPDPVRLLERLRDAVKPDGTISVTLPNRRSATAALFRNRWYHLDLPRHLHHFRPADVRALAEEAGLAVLAVRHTASASGLLGSLDCAAAAFGGAGLRLRSSPRWRRVARLVAWGFARARRGDIVEYTLAHRDPRQQTPADSGAGMSGAAPVLINLGAGLQRADDWINYDRSRSAMVTRSRILRAVLRAANRAGLASRGQPLEWPRETRVHDLTKGIPHPASSVDVVYSSHLLEHLPREAADHLIRECFRVLRPGGWIRLVVPDLQVLARAYVEGDRSYFRSDEPTLADAFMHSLGLPLERAGHGTLERLGRRLLRTDEGGHKWMYDAASVIQRLSDAGFREIQSVEYREGRCRVAASIDSRSRSSVYVEAVKP